MSVTDERRRLLTLDQVAERCQLSRRTVERLVAAALLPALKVGHSVRVDPAELERWLFADEEDAGD
jgi:excisionase family DNA binding protein